MRTSGWKPTVVIVLALACAVAVMTGCDANPAHVTIDPTARTVVNGTAYVARVTSVQVAYTYTRPVPMDSPSNNFLPAFDVPPGGSVLLAPPRTPPWEVGPTGTSSTNVKVFFTLVGVTNADGTPVGGVTQFTWVGEAIGS